MSAVLKSSLSAPRRQLLQLMQVIAFGRIEGLHIRGGEPQLESSPPLVLRTVKLAGHNEPRPELTLGDFELKREVKELFRQLDQIGDGYIEKVEIAHGLPHLMVVADPRALAG